MRWTFLLLLLLTSSRGELRSREKNNEETSEHVLIRSKRRWVLSAFELEEESPGPFPQKLQLHNDRHLTVSHNFTIRGQGVTEEPKGVITINENSGEIYVHKPIDRESYPILKVEFDVLDHDGTLLDETLYFNVIIKDKNDNPPVFMPEVLNIEVPENTKEGVLPLSLQANDRDEKDSDNSRISMKVLSQEPALPKISLKSTVGLENSMIAKIAFTGCFDYDKVKNYKILVEARDHGEPSLTSTATINIIVTDSNTHAPVFKTPKFDAKVMEMETNKEILRIPVEDQDTPNTPGSRAVFTILKGNEDGNYKIETDPDTNEGVLTVIKGKDYERTTITELEIGVENEEPLFLCVNGKPVSPVPETLNKDNTVKIAVKVIDVNDPPVFKNKIHKVYKVEEEDPGDVLYAPTVTDEDSDPANIRYELVHDPAKWMSIDPKTGNITLVKKMDRESPHVHNSTYTVLMQAIDDGEPPATGTGTLVVHLGDKNDNKPHLIANISVMCGNKVDRVRVIANDADVFPFSGPFTFTLSPEDQKLKSLWKLETNLESQTSLISQKILPYGNYTVPLKIADQQGEETNEVLQVVVCDCGEGDVCKGLDPRSSRFHGAAIGILLGALLLMALLLCFVFFCECREKKKFNYVQFDGNQTLIAYNEEGGGAHCKADVQLFQSPPNTIFPLKGEQFELQQNSSGYFDNMQQMGSGIQLSNGFRSTVKSRSVYRGSTFRTRSSRKSTRNSMRSGLSETFGYDLEELLEMKVAKLVMEQQDFPECHHHDYSSEGTMTNAESLDKLSFCSAGGDLDFLQDLGPKFNTLNEICQQVIKEKNIKV